MQSRIFDVNELKQQFDKLNQIKELTRQFEKLDQLEENIDKTLPTIDENNFDSVVKYIKAIFNQVESLKDYFNNYIYKGIFFNLLDLIQLRSQFDSLSDFLIDTHEKLKISLNYIGDPEAFIQMLNSISLAEDYNERKIVCQFPLYELSAEIETDIKQVLTERLSKDFIKETLSIIPNEILIYIVLSNSFSNHSIAELLASNRWQEFAIDKKSITATLQYFTDGFLTHFLFNNVENKNILNLPLLFLDERTKKLVNEKNERNRSLLDQVYSPVMTKDDFYLIELLLIQGARPLPLSGEQKVSCIFYDALNTNNIQLAQLFIRYYKKLALQFCDDDGKTLLFRVRTPEMAKLFVSAGFELEAKDNFGATPFLHIVQTDTFRIDQRFKSSFNDLLTLLYKKGANVNAQENQGYAAIFHAIAWLDLNLLKHLIYLNADLAIQYNHQTPLEFAKNLLNRPEKEAIVSYLENVTKDLSERTSHQNAQSKPMADFARLLPDNGSRTSFAEHEDKLDFNLLRLQ